MGFSRGIQGNRDLFWIGRPPRLASISSQLEATTGFGRQLEGIGEQVDILRGNTEIIFMIGVRGYRSAPRSPPQTLGLGGG